MSAISRLKKVSGDIKGHPTLTVVASGKIQIGENSYQLLISAASPVSLASAGSECINAPLTLPGRRLVLWGTSDANTVTVKSTAIASAVKGTFSGPGGDRILANGYRLEVEQFNDGSWREISYVTSV